MQPGSCSAPATGTEAAGIRPDSSRGKLEARPQPEDRRATGWLVLGVVLGASIAIHLLIAERDLIADEGAHGLQLRSFAISQWEVVESLTTIPGYHLVLAVLCLAAGVETANGARLVSLLMSLPAVLVFYVIARRFQPRLAGLATLQFYFMPILLPYLFLIYTDGFALFLVLLSVHLLLCERRNWSALAGILAVLVRQTNVVWLAFCALLSYLQDFGPRLSSSRLRAFGRKNGLLLAGLAGFAVFVAINGGVAVGDRDAHPLRPGLGNVYLLLFAYLVLALPAQAPTLLEAVRWCVGRRPVLALAVAVFALGCATFSNGHPYNQGGYRAPIVTEAGEVRAQVPFARNLLLQEVNDNPAMRATYFAVVTLSVLTLLRTRWAIPQLRWVLPMALIYLIPSWLIEQRYAFIPLALLLVGRERSSAALEAATLAWNAGLSGVVLWGIASESFFL